MKEKDTPKKEINRALRDLLEGSAQIEQIIEDMDEEMLEQKPLDGGWSIQELLCHHCNGEIVFSYQVKKILSEDDPSLLGFDRDRWARRLDYGSEDTRSAFLLYRFLRIHLLRILRKRPIKDFSRQGIHGEKGFLSLLNLMQERARDEGEAIDLIGERK
jgi:hypothetical protein